jgi:hypothetical protein
MRLPEPQWPNMQSAGDPKNTSPDLSGRRLCGRPGDPRETAVLVPYRLSLLDLLWSCLSAKYVEPAAACQQNMWSRPLLVSKICGAGRCLSAKYVEPAAASQQKLYRQLIAGGVLQISK